MDEKKDKLRAYAALKAQISSLEDQLDKLKPEICQIVEEANPIDKTIETEWGNFEMVQKRKYIYPQDILDLEAGVKEKKKEAEATGEAEFEINPYLKFNPKATM